MHMIGLTQLPPINYKKIKGRYKQSDPKQSDPKQSDPKQSKKRR